jgi:hypothetical protein
VVSIVQNGVVGLNPASLQLVLTTGTEALSCNSTGNCSSNQTAWPPAPNNNVGQTLSIAAKYSFSSILPIGLPQGHVSLTATSTEMIEF